MRRWQKWVLICLSVAPLGFGLKEGYDYLRDEDIYLGIVDQVHELQVSFVDYRQEHQEFPPSLVELAHPELLRTISGEKIQYFRPKTNDSGTNIILVVRYKSHLIEVNKNLERTEK